MASRKRTPGGGRRAQGEFAGKTESLTTRITPDLRAALEREAERNGRSISQQAEWLMKDALDMPRRIEREWGGEHVYALARLVARAVREIEGYTWRHWFDDAFTGRAARASINILMEHLAPEPDGPLVLPEQVERAAQATARAFPGQLEFHRQPEGVAQAVALGLLSQLETYDEPPALSHPRNEHCSDVYYEMPRLRRALRIKSRKEA
jgi:hypothetical protein